MRLPLFVFPRGFLRPLLRCKERFSFILDSCPDFRVASNARCAAGNAVGGERIQTTRHENRNGANMKRLSICLVAMFLAGGIAMAKNDFAAKNAKGAKTGRTGVSPVGNLSKARRERLVAEVAEIRAYLEKSAGSDTNATRLLAFVAELEKEVCGKKYGLVFEEHRERVDVELMENIPVLTEDKRRYVAGDLTQSRRDAEALPINFLIEGDNLAALKLLEKTHRGKIDLIYIDPPYNTGNKDFIYNDSYVDKTDTFRHSKWLSFMKKRLEVAKRLMSDKGVIFISIDDNEQAALKLLCDDVFGNDNFIALLPTIMNLKGNQDQFGFAGTHEYTLVYARSVSKAVINMFPVEDESLDEWLEDEKGYYKRGANLKSTGVNAPSTKRPYLFYPILIDNVTRKVSTIPKDEYELIYDAKTKKFNEVYLRTLQQKYERMNFSFLLPITDDRWMSWRWGRDRVEKNVDEVIIAGDVGTFSLYKKQRPELGDLPSAKPKSVFYKPEYSSGNGTAQLKAIFGDKRFGNPKPLDLIKDFSLLGSNRKSIILDFFAGSGTTGHAVMKLNAEDGGKRKFILVTNNENEICEKVTYERLKRVIAREKYAAALKYFKVDYLPIGEEGYWDLADKLLGHIRELVELENGIDFRHDKSVAIVLRDEEVAGFVKGLNAGGAHILYRGHNVMLDAKARKAIEKHGVEVRTIPDYYYPELEN